MGRISSDFLIVFHFSGKAVYFCYRLRMRLDRPSTPMFLQQFFSIEFRFHTHDRRVSMTPDKNFRLEQTSSEKSTLVIRESKFVAMFCLELSLLFADAIGWVFF